MPSLAPGRLISDRSRGSSLVELLLIVLAVGFLVALLENVPRSVSLITKSKHQSLAREIVLKQIEDKRVISYTNLTNTPPTGDNFTDSRLGLLPAGSGKITIKDCDTAVCADFEEAKEISVEVTWTEGGKLQTVRIRSLIAKGGLNQ
ncbi:MAG: Uncharacterized protein CEO21_429 [Microgenomates group bacterium Gr01-1014_80]|nr:MAG: Uncharacterized protein CEO21_429 [Microgenomates group bacterium Gr01-1014_80]